MKKHKKQKPKPRRRYAPPASDVSNAGEMMDLHETCLFFGGKSSPIDRSTFYRGVRNGVFPKPVKLGSRMARWRLSDCRAALERMQQQGAK